MPFKLSVKRRNQLSLFLRFAVKYNTMLRCFIALLILLSLSLSVQAAQTVELDTGRVNASLISDHDSVAPGQSFYIALRTELDDHWHTYWQNPGDSGEPVQINWVLPDGLIAGDIVWPLPRTIATGPIINYGFEGVPVFPVKFTVPQTAQSGDTLSITADFYYLVCKDVCIPESGNLSLDIPISTPEIDTRWDATIRIALNDSPKSSQITGAINKINNDAVMSFADLPEGDFSSAYFFPYEQGVINHSAPQNILKTDKGLQLTVPAEYAWDNEGAKAYAGVLSYIKDGVYIGEEVALAIGGAVDIGAAGPAAKTQIGAGLITAIIGAFLGGLVLNLMPCVFPIISLKALSLSKAAHATQQNARREAWFYTAGVLATFLLLVGALLAFKAAGSSLGWGFQLQSPKVTGALALLMFIIGLNLLGVFEFGTALQNTGQGLTQKSGASGNFFTGALAVIVATPCTAPFMAGAIGYALAQPALITFLVFMALGLGFAAPFLLLGYVPRLLAKLPKPGPWMARFKEILAFPMFATAIWLAWVMGNQAGSTGLSLLLIAALLISFAIWLWQRGRTGKILAALAFITACLIPASLQTQSLETKLSETKIAWSPEKVTELLTDGRPVFVDFTADWCVTCKVNERAVLSRPKTQALFTETDTAFLVADWTNKNDAIAAELARYERAGVPLYLYFDPETPRSKAEVLPQILTYELLERTLRR